MLQVKSFKIEDGDKLTEFMKTHMLHGKSNILISNGYLAVPIEDGTGPNTEQLILSTMEDREVMRAQSLPIVHSQRVIEIEILGIDKQFDEHNTKIVEADALYKNSKDKTKTDKEQFSGQKTAYEAKKKAEAEIKRLENVKVQKENQHLLNQAELTRMAINIAVYDETIANLEASLKAA